MNQILVLDEESNAWKYKESYDDNNNIFRARFGHTMSEVVVSDFWKFCQN